MKLEDFTKELVSELFVNDFDKFLKLCESLNLSYDSRWVLEENLSKKHPEKSKLQIEEAASRIINHSLFKIDSEHYVYELSEYDAISNEL